MSKLALFLVCIVACGGYRAKVGQPCDPDLCESGLSCIKQYQTTREANGMASCEAYAVYEICTKKCSGDGDCSSVGGKCKASDACGGAKNLCDD